MGNPLKGAQHAINRAVKETKRAVGTTLSIATYGRVSPNIAGGYTNSGAAADLAPPSPVTDGTAGDHSAEYAAEQNALTQRQAAAGVSGSDNDADLLGVSAIGAKRRAASRALLG